MREAPAPARRVGQSEQAAPAGSHSRTAHLSRSSNPGQAPGRNLDVYAADLERIEVLEGPQGTLFGAGAQAGVLPLYN